MFSSVNSVNTDRTSMIPSLLENTKHPSCVLTTTVHHQGPAAQQIKINIIV